MVLSWLRAKVAEKASASRIPSTQTTSEAAWFESAFSADERARIREAFQPLGEMEVEAMVNSAGMIGSLVGHLKKEPLRHLGYRLLERAEILLLTKPPSLHNYHFYLQGRGEYFYRWRDHDDFALGMAIDAYSRQIQIAPEAARAFEADESLGFVPGHAGYRQMRIIEEKRGNLDAARTLCLKAKAEGWNDDWDKQIERIDKKIAR